MSTTTTCESEVTILARVLGGERGEFSPEMAHYILNAGFSDRDKARMNDLAARNQEGALSDAENEEMIAFSKAGTMLAILKSKARRALGVKLEIPTY